MAVLDVCHPDICEFIEVKQAGGLEYFNLSVAVTSRFMRAVTRAGPQGGPGVMGLAELLATLGIPYDSPAAVALAGRVFRVLAEGARDRGFYSGQLMADIARTGTVRQLPGLPADVRAAFVTALEITLPGT